MASRNAPWNWNENVVDKNGKATPEFLAWLQQQLQINEVAGVAVPASRRIDTGTGLSGGGDLSADRTISLDADIGELNDVDTTTDPPIDGQALIWDNVDGEWKPGDVAAGLEVDQEATPVVAVATKLNFTGSGVTVTDAGGGQADIDITGGGGGGGSGGGLYDISMGVPDFATTTQVGDGSRFAWTGNDTLGLNVQYTGANTGGAVLAGYTVPISSAVGEWAILGLQNNVGAVYYGFTAGLYDSALDRVKIIGSFSGGYNATGFMSYSGFGTRTALTEVYNAPAAVGPVWLHVKCDGTTMEFGVSKDGATPLWMFSEACATYVNNPTDLFFGGFFEDSNNVIGTSVSILCVDMDGASRVIGVEQGGGGGGSTILSGSIPPDDSIGEEGDFYLDTTAHILYGPKSAPVTPYSAQYWGFVVRNCQSTQIPSLAEVYWYPDPNGGGTPITPGTPSMIDAHGSFPVTNDSDGNPSTFALTNRNGQTPREIFWWDFGSPVEIQSVDIYRRFDGFGLNEAWQSFAVFASATAPSSPWADPSDITAEFTQVWGGGDQFFNYNVQPSSWPTALISA